ncbi:MAG: SDR family oxidoreductase [Kiritimatiellae bacterium]|nr:SDR family oxidoreductase [Kiritimatiellia bacterium]
MLKEKFDLRGRTALVTGSARGIGRAIALALAEYGAKVIVHGSRRSAPLDEALALVKALSPESFAVAADLSDPSQVDTLPADVDILVANASVQEKIPWQEFPMDEARREFQVNFLATLRMFQRCYPKMKAQKWGRLIVVGSVNERRPHPDMCVYAATKSAQENLVRGVARQVAAEGITVNNLCPGVFNTDRNRECLADPVYGPKVTAAIPMHDYARPEDAAGTALLLASDAGRYITGATIMVDGGLCLPG